MKIVSKILKWVVSILLISIIVINFTLIIKSEMDSNEIPDFLGFTPFVVVSGSMEPTIKINDVIITNKINQSDIKVGDVLSYSNNGIIITHRVYNIEQDEQGQTIYTFKGDSNNIVDEQKVQYSNIVGKYMFSIPIVGTIATYVKTPAGMCVVIGIVLLIYVVFDMIQKAFERESNLKTNSSSKSD